MSFFTRLGADMILPLKSLWDSFITSIPTILGALLIIIFGFLLAEVLEIITIKLLKAIKLNEFISKIKLSKVTDKFDISNLAGIFVKWYVFSVFLLPAASLAKLGNLSVMLRNFATWIPQFLTAIFIIVLGWIAIDIFANYIENTKVKSKKVISTGARTVFTLVILYIGFVHMGINQVLIQQIFLILISAFAFGSALAIGIGYGLGMKDEAKKKVKAIKKHF